MDVTGEKHNVGNAGTKAAQKLRARLMNTSKSDQPARKAQPASPPPSKQPKAIKPAENTKPSLACDPSPQTNTVTAFEKVKTKIRQTPNSSHEKKQNRRAHRYKKPNITASNEYAPNRKPGPLVWVSTGFMNVLALAIPFGVLHVFDRILPNQSAEALAFLIFGLAGVVLVDTVLRIMRFYLIDRADMHHDYNLKYEAVKRVIYSSADKLAETEPSAVLEKLNALEKLRNFHGRAPHLLTLDLPFIGVSFAAIWLVAGHLVWLSVALCLSLGVVFLSVSKAYKANYKRARHHESQRYDFITETFENIFTIKSMAMEPLVQRRFEQLYSSCADVNYQAGLLNHTSRAIGTSFAHFSMICMISAGAVMVIGGGLTIGELGSSALLTGTALQPLLRALHTQSQIQTSRNLKRQLRELYQQPVIKQQSPSPHSLFQSAQPLVMEG